MVLVWYDRTFLCGLRRRLRVVCKDGNVWFDVDTLDWFGWTEMCGLTRTCGVVRTDVPVWFAQGPLRGLGQQYLIRILCRAHNPIRPTGGNR